jgi:hypothetical protein
MKGRKKGWCERGELNPHGREPGGFSYPLQLSLPAPLALFGRCGGGLGSGLSLHHIADLVCNLGAARLVSTPSRPGAFPAGLGSGLPCKRFPRL